MRVSNTRHITIRVKSELYKLYQIYLVKRDISMKDDITAHIKRQIENYRIPKYDEALFSNMEYSKVNFIIDKEDYTNYKIALIKNSTTPTADIIRYMMSVV